MSKKADAVLNIGKALVGISFTALAAIGSAVASMSGNFPAAVLWAGLTALPAAGLAAYDPMKTQVVKLVSFMSDKNEQLKVPVPQWWTGDTPSWQDVCAEIERHVPTILERMTQLIQQDQRVKTTNVVEQIFIDALVQQYLTWAPDPEERRKIGKEVAPLILENISQVLHPVIVQIQQEEAFSDIRTTALSTKEAANLLREILDTVKPRVLHEEELAILRQQYCDALYERWKTLDFRGIWHVETNHPMGLPLTAVFVCPDVLVGVPENEIVERDDEQKSDGGRGKKSERGGEDEQKRIISQDQRLKKEKRVVLQREVLPTVLGKNHRLVILGAPGAGKSTLLHYLLLRLTHEQDTFIQEFPQLADVASLIPLYIRLADYADVWRFHPPGERSLADFLPKYLHQEYPRISTTFVQRQLEQGNVFFLVDGLDEIPDASLRHQVVEQIKVFTQAYPTNRFIVTSRIVGYKEAPLPSDYQPYTLADFSQEQIQLFTQRWCPAYELWVKGKEDQQHLQDAATQEADKLFQATQRNPGVRRLAANPLLLTLLALIQRQGIDLPSHRVELYDRCMTTLLDTWVRARGQSLKFTKNDLTKILCPLAFWMHQHQAIGAIPEEELTQQIVRQLLNRRLARDEYEATERAEKFIRTFHDVTGVLVESGKQRYGFLHPTFEEYFAAKELVSYKEDERNQFIREHLHDPRWREVILLAAGIIGILESKEGQVTELVQKAIWQAGSLFDEWLHRDLLFTGLCLADDVGVSVACEDEIIEQIVHLCLVSPYDSLRQSFSDVLQAWNGTRAGEKAAHIVLSVFDKLEIIANGTQPVAVSSPLENFTEYYQCLVQEYQEEQIKSVHLWMKMLLWKLQTQKTESVIEDASTMLSYSSTWQVRLVAARALGELGANQPEVHQVLFNALSDPNEDKDVREAAARALGELGASQPEVCQALLNALSDPDEDVRWAAAMR